MWFLTFIVKFLLFFLPSYIVLSAAAHFIPPVRAKGWKAGALIILISGGLGYWQGLGEVRRCLDSNFEAVRREKLLGGTSVANFLDFLKGYEALGGRATPEMAGEAERLFLEGPPCTQAHVRRFRGEKTDIAAVCSGAPAAR